MAAKSSVTKGENSQIPKILLVMTKEAPLWIFATQREGGLNNFVYCEFGIAENGVL